MADQSYRVPIFSPLTSCARPSAENRSNILGPLRLALRSAPMKRFTSVAADAKPWIGAFEICHSVFIAVEA